MKYIYKDGKIVEKPSEVSDVALPNIIRDEMSPTKHMADGQMYTSKHKFREATKAAGCFEIGNEQVTRPRKPVLLDRRQRREDIRKALHDLRDGRTPTIRHILEMDKDS
jgi:hypothetical protein